MFVSMYVIFQEKHFELIETKVAAEELKKFPIAVIRAARKKLTLLRAAPDERTLRNWKSLHYEKLIGDRKGYKSIRLNAQWRMVFKLNKKTNPPTVVITAIENYH